ncbi:MAG: hypothetical protein M1815_000286 [Lichina confinis]|nr:MAG: hypothetical protein M1815_000286 [Lichina confinis]
MFRRLSSSLPRDPEFPADLKALGYFVNADDEIRSIADPSKTFQYRINKNERYNEVNKEAINTCIREIVLERLHHLGLETLRLPIGAPAEKPHVPILVSRNLSEKKRVIVVLGEATQDLGIWAYRVVGGEGKDAISRGSAIEFVKRLRDYASSPDADDAPGVIIANLGQLLWWRGGKRSVTFATWGCLPRKTAVHGPMRIDDVNNRAPQNASLPEHVRYVFEEVVRKKTAKDAQIFVIGLTDGADEALTYLDDNWSAWSSRISALALANPLHLPSEITNRTFAAFLRARARSYLTSNQPQMLEQTDTICPCFSSGEQSYLEGIMPAANKMMLDFFRDVAVEGDAFVNASTEIYRREDDGGDGDGDGNGDGNGDGGVGGNGNDNGVAVNPANAEGAHDRA